MPKNDLSAEKLNRHLDLVAIGTAADIVPILDENRILVAHGLKQVQNSSKKGIHSLLAIAGFKNRPINVVNIVFGLAPRINAAGRLGEAARAVRLLMATDRHETDDLAKHLDRLNRSRQQIERGTINEAIMQYNRDVIDDGEKIIVLSGESWHQGVIGIVASKLKEQYNKPVILISVQDGIGKGSARSIPNFDLYQALSQCSDLLESYGGHKMAAGLTIKEENIKEFIRRIKTNADHAITDDMLSPSLSVECEISFQDINQNLLSYLNKMAPFGPGNMRPVFTAKNLKISGLPRIVGENHLKFKACQNKIVISAIGWNLGNYYNMLISNRALNMAFVIEENRWNNIREIQLNIKDIHYADASEE